MVDTEMGQDHELAHRASSGGDPTTSAFSVTVL